METMTTENIPAQASDEPMLPVPVARMYNLNGYRRASVSAGPGEPLFAADQMRAMFHAGQATTVIPAAGAVAFTIDQIADACVKAGLGILECNSLIVALRATKAEGAAGAVDDAKDAARFRFLCDNSYRTTFDLTEGQEFINEAIDAAISAQQGPEGKK